MVSERELVKRLVRISQQAGIIAAPADIISVYVALKSKPFLILTGRAGSGKLALLSSLNHVLSGSTLLQCQAMKGHVWSASHQGSGTLLAEAQARMNSLKIHNLVEEASLPARQEDVFIGCMERISPAEMCVLFADAAFQVERGYLMQLPYLHLIEPLRFTPNILLVASMDTERLTPPDSELLSMMAIIEWRGTKRSADRLQLPIEPDSSNGKLFLRSSLRKEEEARRKLSAILGEPVCRIPFLDYGAGVNEVTLPSAAIRGIEIYLANAWSEDGIGLFDLDHRRNLVMAMHFALTHVARSCIDLQHLKMVLAEVAML